MLVNPFNGLTHENLTYENKVGIKFSAHSLRRLSFTGLAWIYMDYLDEEVCIFFALYPSDLIRPALYSSIVKAHPLYRSVASFRLAIGARNKIPS